MVWSEHFNGLVGKFTGKESQIQVSTFHTIFHKANIWELFKLDLIGFPSSFSEKTHRFCHVQRKGTSLPGCAKVHQLHGKTIPTWGTSHQKQLWNPSGIWWIADSAPCAAGDCRASHRNARFAPRRGDIWPASYGYAGRWWTNLSSKRNTIWRLGRPSRSKWYMVNCWHQSVLTYCLPDMIGVHSADRTTASRRAWSASQTAALSPACPGEWFWAIWKVLKFETVSKIVHINGIMGYELHISIYFPNHSCKKNQTGNHLEVNFLWRRISDINVLLQWGSSLVMWKFTT